MHSSAAKPTTNQRKKDTNALTIVVLPIFLCNLFYQHPKWVRIIVSTPSILAGFLPVQNLKAEAVTFEYHFCSSPVRRRSSSTPISIYIMTMALLRLQSKKNVPAVIRKVSKRNVRLFDLSRSRTFSPRHQVHLEMRFLGYMTLAMQIDILLFSVIKSYVCENAYTNILQICLWVLCRVSEIEKI